MLSDFRVDLFSSASSGGSLNRSARKAETDNGFYCIQETQDKLTDARDMLSLNTPSASAWLLVDE